jgi:hypothetical protein
MSDHSLTSVALLFIQTRRQQLGDLSLPAHLTFSWQKTHLSELIDAFCATSLLSAHDSRDVSTNGSSDE